MHKRSEREWNMALSVARLAPDTGMVTMTCAALLAGHADIERLRRENVLLLEDIREARSDEAHKFASRVNTLQAHCQMVEDRYAMLCKQVAGGLALQPAAPLVVFSEETKFSPEFLKAQADEAPRLDLGA